MEAQAAAERFLTTLVERYRNHPALLGYDLWNENSYPGGSTRKMNCYCEGTRQKLREWLQGRYSSLQVLGKAWGRYSYETWDDVNPPDSLGGYAEGLDWLQFRIDDAFRLLKWRVDLFRRLDPHHLICAHGVAGTLESLPSSAHNEWRSAAMMDVWGLTWVASRHGNAPWLQYQAMDLARAGARGKPFWHAEAEGGPLWMQPQVIGRPREDGRQPDAEDVRIWNLISCASGRARNFVSALEAAAGWAAVRGVWAVRDGWLGDAACGDGGQGGEVGERARRSVEVASSEGRCGAAVHSRVGIVQLRAAGRDGVLRAVDPRGLPGILRSEYSG